MHVLSELDPYFIAGMTDTYFDQTYRDRSSVPGYVRYKLRNICWQRAGAVAQQRERARLAWVAEHTLDPDGWPIPHPTAVVWTKAEVSAVCLRCEYLSPPSLSAAAAARSARRHARSSAARPADAAQYPPLVWSGCNRPLRVGDVVFVRQPYVTSDEPPPMWGWCRACGTSTVVAGTATEASENTTFYCAQWAIAHTCADYAATGAS